MAGQVQIEYINTDRLYVESQEEMQTQFDWWYMKDKFALKTNYNQTKLFHTLFMQNILCPSNCEIENWITLKIEGKLDAEDLTTTNLKPLNSKLQTVNITNNYITNSTWSQVDW